MAEKFTSYTIKLCKLFVAWLSISFLGWCFEVVGRYFVYGVLSDRGFLRLPLCPIYGFSLIFIYFLFGTPREPRGILARLCNGSKNIFLQWGLYFFAAAALTTLLELVTGTFFLAFGVRLWIYEQKFNFLGVICPQYSLLWGALITLVMGVIGDRLFALFKRLPSRASVVLALLLGIPTLADFALRCVELVGIKK